VLGMGEKNFSRWENGRERPPQSLNRLLVALRDGRLTISGLQAMLKPEFSWFGRASDCLSGKENKPTLIKNNAPETRVPADEYSNLAA